jgi:FAD/FMN-containing dehydrogenase
MEGQLLTDYSNYGLGGDDGALAIDLAHLQHFSMDNSTWLATIGGGSRLRTVSDNLHNAGGRAIAHGACPGIGIGGHATIVSCEMTALLDPIVHLLTACQGGLGQASRMWGSTLDHVVEVEVVTADGHIRRASKSQNADLFWVGGNHSHVLLQEPPLTGGRHFEGQRRPLALSPSSSSRPTPSHPPSCSTSTSQI